MRLYLLFCFSLCVYSVGTLADDLRKDPAALAEGGRLYDKWWEEYDLKKPSSTHPAYPATGKQRGANTWRCKECHGWDYKGAAGAYAKGSHYTGIKGIQAYINREPSAIVSLLKNKIHRYDEVMLDYGLLRIAVFVSQGQIDITTYIEKNNKKILGAAENGKPIYNNNCKECHGIDGRERNFKDKTHPEYIGTVANKNPWEAMHKLRNGHPGAFVMGDPMPYMHGKLSLQEQLDLLAYMQTLPSK